MPLFRVRRSDGRITTVSVDPVIVAKAVQRFGGLKEVAALVRKWAFQFRDGESLTIDAQTLINKVNRGRFSFAFGLRLLAAMDVQTLRIPKKSEFEAKVVKRPRKKR